MKIIQEKYVVVNKTDKVIKRQTKNIAKTFNKPIVNDIFGFRFNTLCHIHESYSLNYFNDKKEEI